MPPKRRSARVAAAKEVSRKKVKADTGATTSQPDFSSPASPPPLPPPPPPHHSSAGDAVSRARDDGQASSQVGPKPFGSPPAGFEFTSYEVPSKSKSKPIPCMRSHSHAPRSPATSLIFTHGAGGGLSAPAMTNFCHGFASTGAAITCFQGNMNLKGRAGMFATVLEAEIADGLRGEGELAFGGRSMGARAAVLASQTQTDPSIRLLVLVSYPLIGPSGDVRDQILLDLRPDTKVLFISGDGDSMCDLARLAQVRAQMSAATWMVQVQGADHGMNLKGGAKLKKATEEIGQETGRIAARWIQQRDDTAQDMVVRWDGDQETVRGDWGDANATATATAATRRGTGAQE